jgi:uncharacterized protein HemY
MSRATNRVLNLMAVLVAAGEMDDALSRARHLARAARDKYDRMERQRAAEGILT